MCMEIATIQSSASIHRDDVRGVAQGVSLDAVKHCCQLNTGFDLCQEVIHLRALVCNKLHQPPLEIIFPDFSKLPPAVI